MNSKIRFLLLLPTLFILFACQVFNPSITPTPENNVLTKHTLIKPTFTLTPSQTPLPSATFTSLPPSSTPSPQFTATQSPTAIPLATQLSVFENLWSIVNDTYLYPDFNGLDWNAVHQEYRRKIQSGLTNQQFYLQLSELITRLGDDHSFFLDPQQVAEQEAEFLGKVDYVGIGVMVSAVPERHQAVILSVFHGGSAEAAGLQPRDSILSADGTPILDEDGFLRDIVRGPEGTSVTLTVRTPGEDPREITIIRQHINGDYPLVYQLITTPQGKRIGYILLISFEDSTVVEKVSAALHEMTAEQPLDGLVLDNRLNNGGSSAVLQPVLGYFAGGNLGFYINQEEQRPFQVKLDDINGSSTVPLVVLVGPGTASFGEIFAGILQDIGRAYIIGTTTGGNVEILWGYHLEDGSQLWLANETFRPLNHPEQDWEQSGIIPDLTVPGDFDEYTLDTDPAVRAALSYLSGQ